MTGNNNIAMKSSRWRYGVPSRIRNYDTAKNFAFSAKRWIRLKLNYISSVCSVYSNFYA